MRSDQKEYLAQLKIKLSKALVHLEYSYRKVTHLSTNITALNEEELATWESFAARCGRVIDIFLVRYVKIFVKLNDPGFEGSLRDFVNQAEKLALITQAEEWMKMREMRNIAAHEYTDKDLAHFLNELRKACPRLLDLKKICG